MSIMTHCPGCNAPIQVEEDTTSVVCQFCGTHFDVNLIDVTPTLRKAEDSGEPSPEPPDPSLPEPASYIYNPPIPGEGPAATGDDLYNPPIPNAAGSGYPPPNPSPLPYNPPILQQGRWSGARLWIVIGVVIFAAFCMSCLCLSIFAIRAIR